jgi:hypothetical protein
MPAVIKKVGTRWAVYSHKGRGAKRLEEGPGATAGGECPERKAQVSDLKIRMCPQCGGPMPSGEYTCKYCGAEFENDNPLIGMLDMLRGPGCFPRAWENPISSCSTISAVRLGGHDWPVYKDPAMPRGSWAIVSNKAEL